MIVRKSFLENAGQLLQTTEDPRQVHAQLSHAEPDLCSHISDGMEIIWQKLRSYGLITQKGMNGIDETLYPTILGVVLSSVLATQQAYTGILQRVAEKHRACIGKGNNASGAHVSSSLLDEVETLYWGMGGSVAMETLGRAEPLLQQFIYRTSWAAIRTMLEDMGEDHPTLPKRAQQAFADQVQTMAIICIEAILRRADQQPRP